MTPRALGDHGQRGRWAVVKSTYWPVRPPVKASWSISVNHCGRSAALPAAPRKAHRGHPGQQRLVNVECDHAGHQHLLQAWQKPWACRPHTRQVSPGHHLTVPAPGRHHEPPRAGRTVRGMSEGSQRGRDDVCTQAVQPAAEPVVNPVATTSADPAAVRTIRCGYAVRS